MATRMRARAGDPPRTMPQKIMAGRCADAQLHGDQIEVRIDQVILTRSPGAAFAEAIECGLKRAQVEVAVAYDTICVTAPASPGPGSPPSAHALPGRSIPPELSGTGVLVARPGIGFPSAVHLERFASPARLAVTDDPRLTAVGGAGMLAFVVSPGQLGRALALGTVPLRPPRTVQILLSGRMRPFVCARDVSLELLRRDLRELVERVEGEHQAPVVLEFAGPSARLLSVAERAVLCGIAPAVGAASALFVSDEKTEVFLRDQRRSKAHRTLAPDPGAPCEEVVSVDLATVDPLVMDERGVVRPVRDLAGRAVTQVVLGGDSGCTLRDLLAAAALLKSKRVPPRLEFLLAAPSRQALEVLGQSGALVDLIATGARVIEPDRRLVSGELYPSRAPDLSLRNMDPEPSRGIGPEPVVASAETLAYAVATGTIGDPRSFKRPVRVTVPRALPTDDVLIVRDRRSESGPRRPVAPSGGNRLAWAEGGATLCIVEGLPSPTTPANHAALLMSLDEVRLLATRVIDGIETRAVIAPFIPSGLVPIFASAGILALRADESALARLKGQTAIRLSPVAGDGVVIGVIAGDQEVSLSWLAVGVERGWTLAGTCRPNPQTVRAHTS